MNRFRIGFRMARRPSFGLLSRSFAMQWRSTALVLACLLAGCNRESAPDPAGLDAVATRYVRLALAMGQHDGNYIDAYYGPDSLKASVERARLGLAEIRAQAESLLSILGDSVPPYADTLVRYRHSYLDRQLSSMVARARMLQGEKLSFDEEAEALYYAKPPSYSDAHFDSLLTRLDSLIPGRGSLADRYRTFHAKVMIPSAKVDTVFKTAIASCRARTMAHMKLPEGERFDLEYVKGTSWNAYNWYKGQATSLIQVNLDFPIPVERAVDLACHEGYPGHHVYNASLEQALVRDRGWTEFEVYPLFSPQSFIAEGSANFGIDMAFPGAERTSYERDSLFPLAGLDPALAEQNSQVRVVIERLNYARNEVARRYLNGDLDSAGAVAAIGRYWLSTPEAAVKTLRFITTYRSYVINYNLGRDMVGDWVRRQAGDDPAARWAVFTKLLQSPRLAPDLR